jgi:hypothetical protein
VPASVSAPSAAGRFRFLLTVSSFFPFSLLLSFASLPFTRTALRNAAGDVFSEKENHSLPEVPDGSERAKMSLERNLFRGT